MAENKCGNCFWLAKIEEPTSNRFTHYCKLHYTEEIKFENEKACRDFTEENSDGRTDVIS